MNPEITEEMVEAAAKAWWEDTSATNARREGKTFLHFPWEDLGDDGKDHARSRVRFIVEAAAPMIWQQGFEAGQRSADGDEFVFSLLLGQVGVLLMGDAESMLLWHKDGMFTCTFNTLNFDDRSQHPLIEAAIAGAVIQAEGEALERRARASAERAKEQSGS